MIVYNVKFRKRDLLVGALVTICIFPFFWMALAIVDPLEQTIIEMRQK